MKSWVQLLQKKPPPLQPGEKLLGAAYLSPRGTTRGTLIGEVVGEVVPGPVGWAVSSATQHVVTAMGHDRPKGTTQAHAFPKSAVIVAVTDRRYLLLAPKFSRWTSGLKRTTAVAEHPLDWISDIEKKRHGTVGVVALTFSDGSVVHVENAWVQRRRKGLDQFLAEARAAKEKAG